MVDFLQYVMAGFNNFQDHSRFTEQLLSHKQLSEIQNKLPEVQLLEGFSQLVCNVIEAGRNYILDFHKKAAKIVKTISAHTKITF
jgi:hypothetical protein